MNAKLPPCLWIAQSDIRFPVDDFGRLTLIESDDKESLEKLSKAIDAKYGYVSPEDVRAVITALAEEVG